MRAKKVALVLFVLFSFFLGYFRNFIFLTINAQGSAVYYHDTTRPTLPVLLTFIADKDYTYLIHLKWILTIMFALLFCLLAVASTKLIFKTKAYTRICLALYGTLFIFSFVFIILGYIYSSFSTHAFSISRNLMHIAQSPFTILLLLILIYYNKKTTTSPTL